MFSENHFPEMIPGANERSRDPYPPAREHSAGGQPAWSAGVRLESLANLAHELRTPVQVLLGYLDILRGGDSAADTVGGNGNQEIIERMNSNVQELAQTVDNMIDCALAEAGGEVASDEEIDLADFFAELVPILEAANRKATVVLRIDLAQAPRSILTQRHALRAVVVNLALNAIKFTAAGEVAIRVLPRHGRFDSVDIEVRDTGPGISSDLIAPAFEPMTQLSHTSSRQFRGLGLGLTVVQRNLRVLCGELQVETSSGNGSCFTVTIPCSLPLPGVRFASHV